MANSLIASEKGLQLVNDARDKQGWNRTDQRFLEAAGKISRATLNRFYAQHPTKYENFVAICRAVGIEKWQRIAALGIAKQQTQVETTQALLPESSTSIELSLTKLDELDRELRAWFKALRYEIEDYQEQTEEYFEWIIRIPVRSRFDRVLIHGIPGEARLQDLARVEAVVKDKDRNLDEGWLVTDYRVSRSVEAFLLKERENGNSKILCLTFDELIDQDVDFSPYIEWLEQEVQELGIDRDYLQLDCSKPEKDPRIGKYLPPSDRAEAAEQIDRYMDEWLGSSYKNHISVLGEFGTGKTWFALHYAWVAVRAYQQAKEQRVKRPRLPLLITLRDYAKALNVDTVIAGFFFVKHNIRLNAEVFDRLNRMGKLLILFDGFDEMANQMNAQKAIDNFWALADVIVPNSKVILTCRNEHFPTTADNVEVFAGKKIASTAARVAVAPKFEILNLHPLSIDQIQQVLTNRGATTETIKKILTNPQLFDLVKRPMMVDLVLEALPEISAGKAVDLARVYLYALQHKLARDIETERTFTSMADKVFFLCEVSWAMLSQNELTLHYSRFPARLREVFGDAIEDKHLDHWHYDMMCQSLFIRDAEGNYRPAHKSLLEFFVAFKFAAELGLLHPDFLALVREPSEWDLPVSPLTPLPSSSVHGRSLGESEDGRNPPKSPLERGTLRIAPPQKTTSTSKTPFPRGLGDSDLTTQPAASRQAAELEGISYKWSEYWQYCRESQGKRTTIARFHQENISKLVETFGASPLIPAVMNLLLPMLDLEVRYRQSNPLLELMQWTRGESEEAAKWLGSNAGSALLKLNPYGLEYQDLSEVVLPDIDLVGVGLRDVNLAGATLENVISTKTFSICNAIATSSDGGFFFTGHGDGTIKVWTIDGQELLTFTGHQNRVMSLVVSAEWLFSGSDDKTVKQWDITGKCLNTFTGHQDWVRSMAVSEKWLFSGSNDNMVKQWDIATGKCVQNFTGHKNSVTSLASSEKWLFSGSKDRTVKQWNMATGEFVQNFTGHKNSVTSLAVSQKLLFSISKDRTVRQWNITTGKCARTFADNQSFVRAITTKEIYLFSCGDDKIIKKWDINTGKCIQTFTGHKNSVYSVVSDGDYLFSGSLDCTVKKWDINTGKCIQTFTGHKNLVRAVTVHDQWLFSGSYDKTIKQWDTSTGECIQTFIGHKFSVMTVVAIEEFLFSGSYDKIARQWNIETGKCIQTFFGHTSSIRSITVIGKWLFSGSDDQTVKQWDISTGQCLQTFVGHTSSIRSIMVIGKWLFSGSDDQTVKQWDIETGKCLQTFVEHERLVCSLALSGTFLFSGSYDNTVKQWDIETGDCVATFDNSLCAGANITEVQGLTSAQIQSFKALGAVSDSP